MDFVTFMSLVGQHIVNSDNAYFILYAVATCLLTQLFKKLFVNKTKVDVFHKFDFAVILPFIVGLAFAVLDVYAVQGTRAFSLPIALRIVVSALAIGALSSTMFKLVKCISGQSLSSLMKSDIFGVFYTQLLYFGNIRQQLVDKSLTLQDFIEQVKLISAKAKDIYATDESVDSKRCQLAKLLGGIIDEKSIETCINALNEALISYTSGK
ncbi:MAG: hypothetical protein J1F68_00285 [Clostridiales bacterium]|nr:hypothetical protein [Clostridiales bacterium]